MTKTLKYSAGLLAAGILLAPMPASADRGRGGHHGHHGHHDDDGDDGLRRTYFQFRYESDPSVPAFPPDPDFCSRAPFVSTAYVEGTLTKYHLIRTQVLETGRPRVVGFARACIEIADFTFTPFLEPVKIFWEVTIDRLGTFEAVGRCFPSSNNVPEPMVILGGCVMQLTKMPDDVVGGNMVEAGVLFNPFGVPGYELSSSLMTFHLFSEHRL